MGTRRTLDERAATHGAFTEVATAAQHLKDLWRSKPSWNRLSAVQRESLDLKATKLARILCGDPNVLDHWRDDAGYSELVVADLEPSPTTLAAIEKALQPETFKTNVTPSQAHTISSAKQTPLTEILRRADEEPTP